MATKGATAHEPRQQGLIGSRENPRFSLPDDTPPESTILVSSLQRDQQRKALICDQF